MEDQTHSLCGKCGSCIDGDDSFCRGCGALIKKRGGGTYLEYQPIVESERKVRNRWLYVAVVVGGLVILSGITVAILFLTVRDASGGADSPEALVAMYMTSLEQEDVQSYMDCFEFEHFEDIWGRGISEKYVQAMLKGFMALGDIRFEGVELETVSGDDASVEMRADKGKIITTGFLLDVDYDVAEFPMSFKMYRKGGSWFLANDPMKGIVAPGPNP